VNRYLWLAAAVLSEVCGTVALRAATDHPAWFTVVVIGYTASFFLLAGALREGMALGAAYGIWGASGVTLTAIAAALVFDEALTVLMGLGFLAIVAGVVLVEIGSHRAVHTPAPTGGPS